MKNLILLFFIFLFTLTSCVSIVGGDKKEEVSTVNVDSGFLISKNPFGFDYKFGYGLMVSKKKDHLSAKYSKVWISKKTYDLLPIPNDTTKILVYYVVDIETGKMKKGQKSFFWDEQLNLCTGIKIIKNY